VLRLCQKAIQHSSIHRKAKYVSHY
jgi:hypothetical protein